MTPTRVVPDSDVPEPRVRACSVCGAELLEHGDDLSCPAGHPVDGWLVVTRGTPRRVLAEVSGFDRKEHAMKTGPQGVTQTPGDKVKVKTLDVQKFDSRTHVLWIRLVHHTTLGRYRVRWDQEPKPEAGPGARCERGYLADQVAVDKARASFADEVRKARLKGWAPCERRATGHGGRELVMKPLPAAPGSAAGSAA